MILEIESYRGDTLLFGKNRTFATLKQQFAEAENSYDAGSDNFISFLCRNYDLAMFPQAEPNINTVVDYIYDHDTQNLLTIHI